MKLFIFTMFVMTSMFATTLQAQSEFLLKGENVTMYIGEDTIVIYDCIVRIQNDNVVLVETLAAFHINEECNEVYTIEKEHYVNTRGNYVMYQSPGQYQFWIKIDPTTGKITMFNYTNFNNYKTIEQCSTYSPR